MKEKEVVGILGGGQLAKMSSLAAIRMGFDVAIFDSKKDSPAGALTKNEFIGNISDNSTLKKFCEASTIVTLENEFIDEARILFIEGQGKKVVPSLKALMKIQDKLVQKQTFLEAGLPVAPFCEVSDTTTYEDIAKLLGNKFVLKTRKMGYDGYGNATISSSEEYESAKTRLLERGKLFAEKFIIFTKELALMVAVNESEAVTYPVVETIQENHICKVVLAPAEIPSDSYMKATEIGAKAAMLLDSSGIFGIELFLDVNHEIIINEIAPRPHNSGHYSIDACVTSQFENHIRAILNLPLGSPELIAPYAVMINLLGKKEGDASILNYSDILKNREVKLHLYGKKEERVGRKLGHLTLTGNNRAELIQEAQNLENMIIFG